MQNESKLALICCYGIYDKKIRSEIETKGLSEYYTEVNKQLEKLSVNIAVLCGGYTNSEIPMLSEAETVAPPETHDR